MNASFVKRHQAARFGSPTLELFPATDPVRWALRNLQSANDNLKSKFTGGIAQLVERQLCKLEVRGSNPLASKASMKRGGKIQQKGTLLDALAGA